jgi:hypothetical protein
MKQVPKLANCISLNASFNLWISKGHMIYLLLSLTYWDLIGSLKKWLLVWLRQQKLSVKPWPTI